LCDVDFGHEFWTPTEVLAAGEWRLSQKRSFLDTVGPGDCLFFASKVGPVFPTVSLAGTALAYQRLGISLVTVGHEVVLC
jgi:hypothetical protein